MDMKQKKAEYVEKAEEILRSSSTAERQESNASARRVLADEADELRRKNEEAEREGRP